jgi:hypothetical protein
VRQARAGLIEHLQGELVTGAELHLLGHARLYPTLLVLGPFLGKI